VTDSPTLSDPAVVPFDDRTRRVLELRELVRCGAYRPDPDEVARALLEHWRHAPEIDGVAAAHREFDPARFVVATPPLPAPRAERAVS
jgi:hypothetical protein